MTRSPSGHISTVLASPSSSLRRRGSQSALLARLDKHSSSSVPIEAVPSTVCQVCAIRHSPLVGDPVPLILGLSHSQVRTHSSRFARALSRQTPDQQPSTATPPGSASLGRQTSRSSRNRSDLNSAICESLDSPSIVSYWYCDAFHVSIETSNRALPRGVEIARDVSWRVAGSDEHQKSVMVV